MITGTVNTDYEAVIRLRVHAHEVSPLTSLNSRRVSSSHVPTAGQESAAGGTRDPHIGLLSHEGLC